MKARVSTSNGMKIFNYNLELNGNIFLAHKIRSVVKNIRNFDISPEMEKEKKYVSKRDNSVIVTIFFTGSDVLQFLITKKSDKTKLDKLGFDLIGKEFDLLEDVTLEEVFEILKD